MTDWGYNHDPTPKSLVVMSADFEKIFIDDVSLIDVRAPVEFAKGAFPKAVNLPVLNDDERAEVGVHYKAEGADAARTLGHKLVSGTIKEARVAAWISHIEKRSDTQLYCFRGGLRSKIACEWLRAEGVTIPRIEGGYKRLRGFLISRFDNLPPLTLLSGQTGSGKTRLLEYITRTIDLEALANHRGSAFGGTLQPQPSQIDFENALAIEFLKLGRDSEVVLEDEGRLIGRVHLPLPLQEKMKSAPIVVIKASLDERTENIFDEYITVQWQAYQDAYGSDAHRHFGSYLLTALDAVRKRLGGVNHRDIRAVMESALAAQEANNDLTLHRGWIRSMLSSYYDPMYSYQLSRKSTRIVFEGPAKDVINWYEQHGFAA